MAKVSQALYQMGGTIGDIQFRRTRLGLIADRMSGVSSDQNQSDELWEGSRQNSARFKKVNQTVKDFRATIHPMISNISDQENSHRLTGLFMDIIKRDVFKLVNEQRFLSRHLSMLQGFEFNNSCHVGTLLKNNIQVERMGNSQTHRVRLPIFSPTEIMSQKASHLRVSVAMLVMNPEIKQYETRIRDGQHRPIDHLPIIAETMSFDVDFSSDAILCVIIKVQAFQKEGDEFLPVLDARCNAAAVSYVGKINEMM